MYRRAGQMHRYHVRRVCAFSAHAHTHKEDQIEETHRYMDSRYSSVTATGET